MFMLKSGQKGRVTVCILTVLVMFMVLMVMSVKDMLGVVLQVLIRISRFMERVLHVRAWD